MTAAHQVQELVAQIDQLGYPVTAQHGVLAALLAEHGTAVFVALPDIEPFTAGGKPAGTRTTMRVWVCNVPADDRGPGPLLDATEDLAADLGARGRLTADTFPLGDVSVPAYPLTLFRKD